MKIHASLALATVTAFSFGCWSTDTVDQRDVNAKTIHRSYSVKFSEAESNLDLAAQFRVGGATGTTVRLESADGIKVEEEPLELFDGEESSFNLTGTFYSKRTKVEKPESLYAFKWQVDGDQSITDVIAMPEKIAVTLPTADAQIGKQANLTVTFSGSELADHETVTAYVVSKVGQDDKSKEQDSIATASVKAGEALVINAEALQKLPLGAAQIRVERTKSDSRKENKIDGGASRRSTYESAPVNVTIVE